MRNRLPVRRAQGPEPVEGQAGSYIMKDSLNHDSRDGCGEVCSIDCSEPDAHDRERATVKPKDDCRADPNDDCQPKERAAIVLHDDAELR